MPRTRGTTATVVVLVLFFGLAVFSVNGLALDVASSGLHRILLIQGSFDPGRDALQVYREQAGAKAINSADTMLPDASPADKLTPVQDRITGEAAREHQLTAPDTFRSFGS